MVEIDTLEIETFLTESVVDVFDMMMSMDINQLKEIPDFGMGKNRIVGSVGFAGEATGIISIHVNRDFARIMTAAMMGVGVSEIEGEDEIKDVICEISNIIGGNLKSAFTDFGLMLSLSTPSITYGSDFKIESMNMQRYETFAFQYQEHVVLVQVGLKIQEHDEAEKEARKKRGKVDIEAVRNLDIKATISKSVLEMFEMMLSMKAEISDTVLKASTEVTRTVGSVSFAGEVMGLINIHVTDDFAKVMTAAMLGMEIDELEGSEEVMDVIGEISNIIGGNLKSAFTDIGVICELSTPNITTGNDFEIETLNMERYERFAFNSGDETIFVEVGVKTSEMLDIPKTEEKVIAYDVVEEGDKPAPREDGATDASEAGEGSDTLSIIEEAVGDKAPEAETGAAEALGAGEKAPEKPQKQTLEHYLDLILDIPVEITVELGRTRQKISDVVSLGQGSLVELNKLAEEPVDILVNDVLVARGKVVVDKDKYGIQVTELMSLKERIKSVGYFR